MGITDIVLIALGLSMDAFAVAVCKGLAMQKFSLGNSLYIGAWFGIFQGLMPLIGFFLGFGFAEKIGKWSPFIAFVLLFIIGASMIKEALSKSEEEADPSVGFKIMFVLSVATSIDALAVGITFAIGGITIAGIFPAAFTIAAITFCIAALGVYIGNIFGAKYKSGAELVGGLILVGMGIKFLVEGILNF